MSTVKMMIQPRADLERSCYSRSPFRSDWNDAKVGQAFRILTLKLFEGSTSKCQGMNQELGELHESMRQRTKVPKPQGTSIFFVSQTTRTQRKRVTLPRLTVAQSSSASENAIPTQSRRAAFPGQI